MASLVQRTRQVVAAEDDDFFLGETILYYLNKSKRKVISFMTRQELQKSITTQEGSIPGTKNSLRALDGLRANNTTTVASSFTDSGSYWKGEIDFPNDMNQILNLRYNNKTILRELNANTIYMLDWGNLVPTIYEGYYYVTDSNGKVFETYLHEDPVGNDINIFYIKNPAEITMEAETFTDIPEQLENAIIYGAALMMISQESVKDPEGNVQVISEIYQNELQNSIY